MVGILDGQANWAQCYRCMYYNKDSPDYCFASESYRRRSDYNCCIGVSVTLGKFDEKEE